MLNFTLTLLHCYEDFSSFSCHGLDNSSNKDINANEPEDVLIL
jgi:hypothetical protein